MSRVFEQQAQDAAPQVLALLEEFRHKTYILTRADMTGRLGITDRVLRAAVAELRKQGHLVVADENGGYRFAVSWNDVNRYTASLKSRIAALREIVAEMETTAARTFPKQPETKQASLW